MKKSTDEIQEPKSLLAIGNPGTGKTTTVTQFPGTFLLDLDRNISGPIKFQKRTGINCEFYHADPYHDDAGNELPREEWFRRAMTLLMEAAAMPDVKTLVVDSLTAFVELAMVEVLRLQGRKLGNFDFKKLTDKSYDDQMQVQDWGAFAKLIQLVIFKLKATGLTIIFTGHMTTKEDEKSKLTKQFIAVPGKTAEVIAGYFSDVWLFESEVRGVGNDKKEVRFVTTFPQSFMQSALGLKAPSGIKSGEPLDASKLIQQFLS